MDQDPRHYIEEIRQNVKKLQSQGAVTPNENAFFGMIDGLAGLQLAMMHNVADLKHRVESLERERAETR